MNHIDSHYSRTINTSKDFPQHLGNLECEVLVIGGGMAGLCCADLLSAGGKNVILVEANKIGWGASGRNGGFVSAGFALSMRSVVKRWGYDHAKELYRLSCDGRDRVSANINKFSDPKILQGRGWLKLSRAKRKDVLKSYADWMAQHFDVNYQFISDQDLPEYVRSDVYQEGIFDPNAFHIQPLRYCQNLAVQCVKQGVQIFEHSPAINIRPSSGSGKGRWEIIFPNGRICADHVVISTSAYGAPFKPLKRYILPIATYVVGAQVKSEMLNKVIPFSGCIADTRRAGDYYRKTVEDGKTTLIWGGRITTQTAKPDNLAAVMHRDITKIYPQLSCMNIQTAWMGLMGYTRHKMPLLGQPKPGLWIGTGFGGHGLNTTHMAGALIANAIMGLDDQYRRFAPFGFAPTYGIAGRVVAQLEYWRLGVMDRLEESGWI